MYFLRGLFVLLSLWPISELQSQARVDGSYLSCERLLVLFNSAIAATPRFAHASVFDEVERVPTHEDRLILENLGVSPETLAKNSSVAAFVELANDGVDLEDLADQFGHSSMSFTAFIQAMQAKMMVTLDNGKMMMPNEFIIQLWNEWKTPEQISVALKAQSNGALIYSGDLIREIVRRHVGLARYFAELKDRRHPVYGVVIENGVPSPQNYRLLASEYTPENLAFLLGLPLSEILLNETRSNDLLKTPELEWNRLNEFEKSLINDIVLYFQRNGVDYRFRERMTTNKDLLPFSRGYLYEQLPDPNRMWLAIKHRAAERNIEIKLMAAMIDQPSDTVRRWRQKEGVDVAVNFIVSGKKWSEVLDMKRSELGFDPRAFLGNAPFTSSDLAYAQRIFDTPYDAFLAVHREVLRRGGTMSASHLRTLRPPTVDFFDAMALELSRHVFRYYKKFQRIPSVQEIDLEFGTEFSRWQDSPLEVVGNPPVRLGDEVVSSLLHRASQEHELQDPQMLATFRLALARRIRLTRNWLTPTPTEIERIERVSREAELIVVSMIHHFKQTGQVMKNSNISEVVGKSWVQVIGSRNIHGIFDGYEDLLASLQVTVDLDPSWSPDQRQRLRDLIRPQLLRSAAVRAGRRANAPATTPSVGAKR